MIMKQIVTVLFIGLSCLMCINSEDNSVNQNVSDHEIICSENGCKGTYAGPEFVNNSDVAHQFSNQMSDKVGIKLKQLYDEGKYSKVDLSNIKMSTKNMDSKGNVIYSLEVPFIRTPDSCDAFTAFDHRGGWGHKIKKEDVLEIFKNKDNLKIIELNTGEGLQEFWIQWRHETKQSDCK